MMNSESEGELAVTMSMDQWAPLYFTTEDEARQALATCVDENLTIYQTKSGQQVYHEADKNRFVIFIKDGRKEE